MSDELKPLPYKDTVPMWVHVNLLEDNEKLHSKLAIAVEALNTIKDAADCYSCEKYYADTAEQALAKIRS